MLNYNENTQAFLEKAEKLKPILNKKVVYPKNIVTPVKNSNLYGGWEMTPTASADNFFETVFRRKESTILDFGDHLVGYLKFKIDVMLSPQDAPLKIRFTFGELPFELMEPFEHYDGWLSSSWLQEELIFIDVLPAEIALPRRYCFRYLKIEVLDTSKKYGVKFDEMLCEAVTSAELANITAYEHTDRRLEKIDKVGLLTLMDCMQTVYEDGPKRDRRLWIGDLRLQAQVNYVTFKEHELLKRCIYLFAGLTNEEGLVPSCIFETPNLHADNIFLYDYSLFFISIIFDYYYFSKDEKFLREMWPTAFRQLELATKRLDENHVVKDSSDWWSFIDWNDDLNKQAPTQGVLIYCLKQAVKLAEVIGDETEIVQIKNWIEKTQSGAKTLWDKEKGAFISGACKQISWASQVWMVLAEVLSKSESAELLTRFLESPPQIDMITPYMVHHLVDALFISGLEKDAKQLISDYWGDMIDYGADRFFELYNPENRNESPYGGNQINSFCHAWSCTPTYFIRKYF